MSEGTVWVLKAGGNTLPMVTKKVLRRGTDLKSGGGMVFFICVVLAAQKKKFFFFFWSFSLIHKQSLAPNTFECGSTHAEPVSYWSHSQTS